MSAIFVDAHARDLFVEGLVELLSQIFSIDSEERQAGLKQELTEQSDEALVAKKELIEQYADTLLKLNKEHLIKIEMVAHDLLEKEERAGASLNLNFS